MTDEPETQPRADEPPTTEAPVPSHEDQAMAHVDAALVPAFKHVDNLGTASYADLKHVLTCMRQALAHLIYGPQSTDDTGGESLDVYGDQLKANREASVDQAQPVVAPPPADVIVEPPPPPPPPPPPITDAEARAEDGPPADPIPELLS